ncbi:hypothetical protein TNIN_284911 [Trichonephila inaurata madagascariensis]|uniref:Uncharacterized protein n=1 Tax=Trichonephila inaurata madagascariensis TaxID=2747483 RepID=A0A8X6WQX8_9ARAC|nr:hypothetical protein TNIN_284911 [Trichonephila inaurata madagascariensis]
MYHSNWRSGVFGGILSVCSFLAIPFAASLTYYNASIVVCVIIGVFFQTMCFYCFRTWYRLRLNDLIYADDLPQRFPRLYDPSESAEMRNEDTWDGSMFFPLEDVPQQLEERCVWRHLVSLQFSCNTVCCKSYIL